MKWFLCENLKFDDRHDVPQVVFLEAMTFREAWFYLDEKYKSSSASAFRIEAYDTLMGATQGYRRNYHYRWPINIAKSGTRYREIPVNNFVFISRMEIIPAYKRLKDGKLRERRRLAFEQNYFKTGYSTKELADIKEKSKVYHEVSYDAD